MKKTREPKSTHKSRFWVYILSSISFMSCQTEKLEPFEVVQTPTPIDNNVNTWTEGVIPYGFNDNVPKEQKDIILEAMSIYEGICNVTYKEYPVNDLLQLDHGLLIKYSGAVQSSVFPSGMPEYISDFRVADIRFFDMSVALHELGHNLGRPHEQQLANALDYMIIDYSNISQNWMGNYEPTKIIFLTPIELNSNMAYSGFDASIDPDKPTTTDLEGNTYESSKILTQLDKDKYLELYPYKNN